MLAQAPGSDRSKYVATTTAATLFRFSGTMQIHMDNGDGFAAHLALSEEATFHVNENLSP